MKRISVPFKRVLKRVLRKLVLLVVFKTLNLSLREKEKAKKRKGKERIPKGKLRPRVMTRPGKARMMARVTVAQRARRTTSKGLATRTKVIRAFVSFGLKAFIDVETIAPYKHEGLAVLGAFVLTLQAKASLPAPKVLTATKAAVVIVAASHVLGTSASVASVPWWPLFRFGVDFGVRSSRRLVPCRYLVPSVIRGHRLSGLNRIPQWVVHLWHLRQMVGPKCMLFLGMKLV